MSERTCLYTFKVYPEHLIDDNKPPIEVLKDCLFGYSYAISPLHDRDLNDNGEFKKPHYHVNIKFRSAITQNSVIKKLITAFANYGGDFVGNFSYLGNNPSECSVQPARSSQSSLDRYLIHLGYDDKVQYNADDIFTMCYNLDLGTDLTGVMQNVIDYVLSPVCHNFSEAVIYFRSNNMIDELNFLVNHSYFVKSLF